MLLFLASLSVITKHSNPNAHASSGSITQTSKADFQTGSLDTNLDIDSVPGDIKSTTTTNTDTTKNDFDHGSYNSNPSASTITNTNGNGAVAIDKSKTFQLYTANTQPAFIYGRSNPTWSSYDPVNGVVFVGDYCAGVSAIDTNNTFTQSDDTLLGVYEQGVNSPQMMGSSCVHYVYYDTTSYYLYVGNGGGLSVIDTKGTKTLSDDVYKGTYNGFPGTLPQIIGGDGYQIAFDTANSLVYITSYQHGVSVVDMHNTPDPADDTLVCSYYTGSTPAIPSNKTMHVSLDAAHNLVYIGSEGGLTVINTQGTKSCADDALVGTYTSSGSPALYSNIVNYSYLDTGSHYLYIGSFNIGATNGGVKVINTNNTVTLADDTLVTSYNSSTTPALHDNNPTYMIKDPTTNYLYISTYGGGVLAIDTKGTNAVGDDTIAYDYHSSNYSDIGNYSYSIVIDIAHSRIFMSNENGGYWFNSTASSHFGYTPTSTPMIGTQTQVNFNEYDNAHHLLFVATQGYGVTVIDTKGTQSVSDDVTLGRYFDDGTGARTLKNNNVHTLFFDTATNYLYAGTEGGVSVINTSGTTAIGDDSLLGWYATTPSSGVPAIVGDTINSIVRDSAHNLLFFATNGVAVINTAGTNSLTDDSASSYTTSSSPAISGDTVYKISLDTAHNVVFIATGTGTTSINTQGTASTGDDTLVMNYSSSSSPALICNDNRAVLYEPTLKLLYIGCYDNSNGGVSVIDTNNTTTGSDDTLVTIYKYTYQTNPGLHGTTVIDLAYQTSTHLLFVSTYNAGSSVIDTAGTVTGSDDTQYNEYTGSALNYNYMDGIVDNVVFDTANDMMFMSGFGSVAYHKKKQYLPAGEYQSRAFEVSDSASKSLSWNATLPASTSVAMQARLGTATKNNIYINQFNDGNPSEFVGDYYSWGTNMGSAVESDGIMRLSNPQNAYGGGTGNGGVDFWIDTGHAEGYFSAGTTVEVRYRYTSTTRTPGPTFRDFVYLDDWNWDGSGGDVVQNNQWVTIRIQATHPFTRIGFEPTWAAGTFGGTDTMDIDYIRIDTVTYNWGSWSPVTNGGAISGATSKNLVQYKASLATSDPFNTPILTDVTLNTGYPTSAQYVSSILDKSTNTNAKWTSLTSTSDIPANSSLVLETRSGTTSTPDGSWSAWSQLSGNIPSSPNAQYLQFRASFLSSTGTAAPTVHDFTASYTEMPTVQFGASQSITDESGSDIGITVLLSSSFPEDITVDYSLTGGSATSGDDFTLNGSTLTIPAGATVGTISVHINADNQNDPNETIILHLSNAVNAVLGSVLDHTMTITLPGSGSTTPTPTITTTPKPTKSSLPGAVLTVTPPVDVTETPTPEPNGQEGSETTATPTFATTPTRTTGSSSGSTSGRSDLNIRILDINGSAIAGAVITFPTGEKGVTDASGSVTFKSVKNGTYKVVISYAGTEFQATVTTGKDNVVSPPKPILSSLPLSKSYDHLVGSISDSLPQPLAGVVKEGGILWVPAAIFLVMPSFSTLVMLINFLLLNGVLFSALSTVFKKKGENSGTVTDDLTHQGIAFAVIKAKDQSGTVIAKTVTDFGGKYFLKLPAGAYVLEVSHHRYKMQQFSANITMPAEIVYTFALVLDSSRDLSSSFTYRTFSVDPSKPIFFFISMLLLLNIIYTHTWGSVVVSLLVFAVTGFVAFTNKAKTLLNVKPAA